MASIRTAGLTKDFGDLRAVNQIDLDLPEGGVAGFVGPNGAGKSTTIRMLLGLIKPTSGDGEVLGHPIDRPATYLHRVGALIEAPAFYPTLTGKANLRVFARLGGQGRARIPELLEIVGLGERGGDRYSNYSLGMKQRLGIALALLPDPDLLILDEPTNGLDPQGIVEIRSLLMRLGAAGKTVFVSSHLLAEIQAACDAIVMIDHGVVIFAGSMGAAFFGIVALALFASNLAGEFHEGTIRMLFVTEPNRLEVLAGKLLALSSFVAAGIAATLAISIGAGALMATTVGVETSSWWTADGVAAIGAAYLNLTAAALIPALIGATIAVLTRSTTIAISVGLGWFVLAETLIGSFWSGLSRWGPAAVSNAIAAGGTDGLEVLDGASPAISYTTATLLAIGYSLAALTITSTVLARRDVTS